MTGMVYRPYSLSCRCFQIVLCQITKAIEAKEKEETKKRYKQMKM
jgi:hypothetical protein